MPAPEQSSRRFIWGCARCPKKFTANPTVLEKNMSHNARRLCFSIIVLLWVGTPSLGQRLRATLKIKNMDFAPICFSPDGKTIATGGREFDPKTERAIQGWIMLWDVATGKRKAAFQAHPTLVKDFCFSPDGTMLLSCDHRTIKFLDARIGKVLRTLKAVSKTEMFFSIFFRPDGKTFVTHGIELGKKPGTRLRFWDTATGKLNATWIKPGIFDPCFHPDGKTLAIGCDAEDKEDVRLWDVQTGTLKRALKGHKGDVRAVAWSPNGKMLASADMYGTIRLWESLTHRPRLTIRDPGSKFPCAAICPKRNLLALGNFGHRLKKDARNNGKRWGLAELQLRDLFTGELKARFDAHYFEVFSIQFSPDGNTMATVGADCKVKLWDVSNVK